MTETIRQSGKGHATPKRQDNTTTSYQRHVGFLNAVGPRVAARYSDGGALVSPTRVKEAERRAARKRQRQARKTQRNG